MPAVAATFASLTSQLDYPMLVVTTAADDERAGCLVGFATQCSIDPARYMVCLSDKNHTFLLERWVLGDHAGYVLEPFAARNGGNGAVLGFSQVRSLVPGHDA